MKLFVSLLFLATATAGLAQNQSPGVAVLSQGRVTVTNPAGQASPQEIEALAEMSVLAQPSQAGCPLMMTSAHLNWPASYLPVTSAEKVTEPNLALNFRNTTGKPIRTITITAQFLAKKNLYQLDATTFDLRLSFSEVDAADKAAEQLREIRLPQKMYAYGVTRVSLDQVMFADGSFWMAAGHNSCSLDVKGSTERVEAR
jgi:hypothetical protein